MEIDITGEKSNGSQEYHKWREEARQSQEQARQERALRQAAEMERWDAQAVAVADGLDRAVQDVERAEEQQARFWEEGEYAKAAAAGREIAQGQLRISQYQEAKASIESQRRAAPPIDPVEAYISQHSSQKQAYLRRHRDAIFGGDDGGTVMTTRLTGAHYHAIADGVAEDSPEYFQRLEAELGQGGSGSSASYSAGGGTRVRLTKDEVDFCRESGQDPAEYARNKARLLSGDAGGLQYTSQKYGAFNPSSSGSIVGR